MGRFMIGFVCGCIATWWGIEKKEQITEVVSEVKDRGKNWVETHFPKSNQVEEN